MLTLTPAAIEKVKQLIEEDELKSVIELGKVVEQEALRVAVKTGGCSGLSYDLTFDSEVDGDIRQVVDGVVVIVDSESAPYLEDVVLDYKETLMGAGFSFQNPSATRSCGCGSSFS